MRKKTQELETQIFKEMKSGIRAGVKGADVKEGDKHEDVAKKETKPSPFGDILLALDYSHAKNDFAVTVLHCQNLLDPNSIAKLQMQEPEDNAAEPAADHDRGEHDADNSEYDDNQENDQKKTRGSNEPSFVIDADDVSKVNAFVKLSLLPYTGVSKKTKVVSRTNNPQFSQRFHFKVAKSEIETSRLLVTVWNHQLFGKKSFLGEVTIPLQYETFQDKNPKLFPLRTTETHTQPSQPATLAYRGEISLKLCFKVTNNPNAQIEDIDETDPGKLIVVINGAVNLMHPRKRTCSAFSTCKLYDENKQEEPVEDNSSEPVRKSNSPEWKKRVQFENQTLESLYRKCLEVSVFHNGKKKKKRLIGGVRLNLATTAFGTNATVLSPVELPNWMDAKGDECMLWYGVIERPNKWIAATLPLRNFLDDVYETATNEK